MRSTASTRNGYFDYRFDPEKSSRAYAQYIKKLHARFGDWYLAMAAYDWGPGGIERAVQRTGFADFWELYRRNAMPAETRAYVPKILAAVIMAKNPEKYGLDKLTPSPPVIYDTVNTSYSISLPLIADLTDTMPQEIAALNPALLRVSTPQDIPFDLHIPPGTRDVYLDRLKMIPEDDRASWRFHVAKAGESLETIATQLHGRAAEVADVNHVTVSDPLKPGDELVIPVASLRQAVATQRYKTHRGDTLVTVADRFNVSVEQFAFVEPAIVEQRSAGSHHLRFRACAARRGWARITRPTRPCFARKRTRRQFAKLALFTWSSEQRVASRLFACIGALLCARREASLSSLMSDAGGDHAKLARHTSEENRVAPKKVLAISMRGA